MKKLILIALFSIGIFGMNAQCIYSNQTNTTTTFTIYSINYTVIYLDCNDGTVQITDILANGSSVKGKLAFIYAIQGFFRNKPNVKTIKMNASCKRWVPVKIIYHPEPMDRSGIHLVTLGLRNCNSSGACCIFKNNDSSMNEAALSVAEMHKECKADDCFEICEGY